MDQQNVSVIFYVAISLLAIGVLMFLLLRKKKCKCRQSSEGFRKCICSSEQGGRERKCQDTVTVNNLYVTDKLTEFTKLPDRGWDNVSPGDTDFPVSQGCNWSNSSSPGKGWVKWDFDQFGN